MTCDGRDRAPSIACAPWAPWSDTTDVEINVASLRLGFTRIEAEVRGRQLTAQFQVDFEDDRTPPLRMSLDRATGAKLHRVFKLSSRPRRAVLRLSPCCANAAVSIRLTHIGIARLLPFLVAKALPFARRPRLALAKARQVLQSRTSLSFRQPRGSQGGQGAYAAWRAIFEAPEERARISALGRKPDGGRDTALVISEAAGLGALVDATEQGRADIIVILHDGHRLADDALDHIGAAFRKSEGIIAATADYDAMDGDGRRRDPAFWSAIDRDLLIGGGYAGVVALKCGRPLREALAGVASADRLCVLFAVAERVGEQAIQHIPRIVSHRRADVKAAALCPEPGCAALEPVAGRPGLARVRYQPPEPAPRASIIVLSRDHPDLLGIAVDSIKETCWRRFELIIVDNGSHDPRQLALLEAWRQAGTARVIRAEGEFNYSQLNNLGRRAASGTVLVFLNDDVRILDPGWLDELVAQMFRPGIGCVGPLLVYPDSRVQHAGIALGVTGVAGHVYRFADPDAPDADIRLVLTHSVSAVTGACLAVRAEVFDRVGGFDEGLPVTLNDVDLCLKVRALGLRNLVAPRVRVEHRESASRGIDSAPEQMARGAAETRRFLDRWGRSAIDDPFYSPNWTLSDESVSIRS